MDAIFYVWLGIIVAAAVIESLTTDLISVWFIGYRHWLKPFAYPAAFLRGCGG